MLTIRTEPGKFQYPGKRLWPEEMDDIDRKLILALCEDPRMPLKKLASSIGISRQALNHRMRNLVEAGLFKTLKGEISMFYLDGVVVWIWGRSKAASLDKALDALGKSEFTARVVVAGGNELLVWGFLRHMSDLSAYVKFVRETAEMPDVTVGLPCFFDGINPSWADGGQPPKTQYRELSALDLRIIAVLQIDSRMPIEEIARRTGTSPRTARRHIEVMRRGGSLDYAAPWDIPPGADMVTVVHITLKSGADAVTSARRLLRIDPIHFVFLRQFSNLPGFLVGLVTSDRMRQIREILSEIREDKDVLTVTPNLIYNERGYDSWDYRLLTRGH
jgi:DNA-binding Lrp family transcriptional regulator